MKTDICSKLSYDEIKESGYMGKNQARYLYIFVNTNIALTHKQATLEVENTFDVKMPERNGRIAELEEMGFLKKVDIVVCEFTNKKVNRWKWTGRTEPLPSREEWVCCDKCEGKGKLKKKVYYQPELTEQKELF